VYYNSAPNGPNHLDSIFNYSCTTPLPPGPGNFTNAPQFVNTNGWSNLRLQPSSPCINAGLNDYVTSSTDLDGNPRIVGGTVDLGAYEFDILLLPEITTEPSSRTNVLGTTAAFSVTATGLPPLAYQWQKNGTNLVEGGHCSGVATANLTLAGVQYEDAGAYTVEVSNLYGTVTSMGAQLVVVAPDVSLQVQPLAMGQMQLLISGPAGLDGTLQGSPDLFHWADLNHYANPSGLLVLTNIPPAGYNAYFYRTVCRLGTTPPAGPAPVLRGPAVLPGGLVRFQVDAAAGTAWRVEGSPDLVHWGNYGVVTNPSGSLTVTNTPFARPGVYFYRVAQP